MKKRQFILLFGDAVLILAATELSTWIRFGHSILVFSHNTGASTFTLLVYLIMLYIFDLFNVERAHFVKEIPVQLAVAVGFSGIISAVLFYSLPNWVFGRGIFLIQMSLVLLLLSGWRWVFITIISAPIGQTGVLIIGAGRSGTAIYALLSKPDSPYKPVGFIDDDPAKLNTKVESVFVLGPTDQLLRIAAENDVNMAILAITHDRSQTLIDRVIQGRLHGLTIMDMPAIYEELKGALPVEHLRQDWLLYAHGFSLISKQYIQRIKRVIDFAVSGVLLVVSSPIMLVIAMAIKLESPGPVLFRQERMGQNGVVFFALKFRSMKQDAEAQQAVWAAQDDRRVTHVGRIIRFLRADELPQIVNVFRGQMSLIGPRPERPEFVHELEAQIPFYGIRHAVRPGITGWAQVNYGYGSSVEDALKKLEYDLFYIKNMSIIMDLRILLKTIGVILFGQGAR